MAVKAWFDYNTYMENKLTQIQAAEPNAGWTAASLKAAFEKAGFAGDTGTQAHFLKYGHSEDVSPNKLFDADYYYQAKAIAYYTSTAAGSEQVTKAEVLEKLGDYGSKMEAIIKGAGMDAWTHYTKYGTKEGINPSNDFDTSSYMDAKIAAMNGTMTANEVYAAFKKAGFNALMHEQIYAGKGGANEVTTTSFPVPEDEQFTPAEQGGATAGGTFTLTTGVDYADTATAFLNGNVVSTFKFSSSNESVVAVASNTQTENTLSSGDILKDASANDKDTLKLTLRGTPQSLPSAVEGIENIEITAANTAAVNLDLSMFKGVKNIIFDGTPSGNITLDGAAAKRTIGDTGVSKIDASAISVTGAALVVDSSAASSSAGIEILGTAGADTVTGGKGNDTVDGGKGADSIVGGQGNDQLSGGAGNDTITGGAGDDTLDGGDGNDVLNGGAGSDAISGGKGNDIIDAGAGDNTIDGGAGDDNITSGAGKDSIDGGDGNDVINSGDGDDTVNGGDGNDNITTAEGNDSIDGGEGNDTVDSGAGNDVINGGDGTDSITSGTGNDTIKGGAGNDAITLNADAPAHTHDRVVFEADLESNGVDVVTNFNLGALNDTANGDVLDFSAFLGEGNIALSNVIDGNGVFTANDVNGFTVLRIDDTIANFQTALNTNNVNLDVNAKFVAICNTAGAAITAPGGGANVTPQAATDADIAFCTTDAAGNLTVNVVGALMGVDATTALGNFVDANFA